MGLPPVSYDYALRREERLHAGEYAKSDINDHDGHHKGHHKVQHPSVSSDIAVVEYAIVEEENGYSNRA
jgi:hypothetical protein